MRQGHLYFERLGPVLHQMLEVWWPPVLLHVRQLLLWLGHSNVGTNCFGGLLKYLDTVFCDILASPAGLLKLKLLKTRAPQGFSSLLNPKKLSHLLASHF